MAILIFLIIVPVVSDTYSKVELPILGMDLLGMVVLLYILVEDLVHLHQYLVVIFYNNWKNTKYINQCLNKYNFSGNVFNAKIDFH